MALFARHSLPDVTLHAMASIADGIALGVERMRTEAALRESEQRTRLQSAALESTANGVVITDVHGTIQWVNRAFTELTGYSAAEAIGENPRLLRSGHHGESFYEALWQTISGGRVWKGELINRRKDGRLYHEEMTITPVRDSGAITHFVAVKQDISERKQTEEERLKFFALIENSADFIGMATLEGKPFYLNAAGRALVGLGRDIEVSATEIADYWEPETAAVLRDVGIPTAFAAGHWSGEGGLRHFTTRDLIPVHVHAFLVRDPRTRQPICLATIVRNISDIKETEQRLAQVNRELRDVSRLSGMAEVATSVLHNVGNVLNSVNVSADRIADKLKRLRPASLERVAGLLREHAHDLPEYLTRDPRGRELPGYLNVLVEQLGEPQRDILPELALLRDNIEHIRQVVRMQQTYARATGVFETMALADLVEDAIRINAASCARHDIQVIREYTPAPPFPIDKHKVLQILVNLLCNAKNALDAAGRRDGTLTVRVGMNAAGMARVSVTDNGVGIAPENLTRVFQHGFTTRKDGHGFGLHSGALAAQELGGSLTAHSEGAGQGAVFTLDLPCPAAEDAA
jgi:PAS domain S-box-containing protein